MKKILQLQDSAVSLFYDGPGTGTVGGIWAIGGASCGMKSWGPWENHRENGGFMGFDGILWAITMI